MKVILMLSFLIGSLLASEKGYPAGFMGDCPGMNRSTTLSESTKRSQYVVVLWPKDSLFSNNEKKCKLGTSGAACVAKHVDLKKSKILYCGGFGDYERSHNEENYKNSVYVYQILIKSSIIVSWESKMHRVMISGYLDASFSPLVRSVTIPYLDQGYSVIIMETFPVLVRTYPIAARMTKPLGKLLGEMLAELTYMGLDPSRLEMVGGSLGAHIATYASMKYHEMTGLKPARLTGLDPAGPCFRNVVDLERMNRNAALKVDAVHTNIDGLGLADPVGHVDFYVNGGEYQPAMVGDFIMPCFLLCSHVRSAFYWMIAQRNPDKFVAVQCDSLTEARSGQCYNRTLTTNYLGPNTDFNHPGIYYLPVAETIPYYLGKKGMKYRSNGINNYITKIAPDKDLVV